MELITDLGSNIPPIETDLRERLIAAGIKRRGDFTLSSGIRTDTYFDVKKIYGDPNLSEAVASGIARMFDDSVTCVAGSGYGGALLAKTISGLYGFYFTFMRAEQRNHGTGQRI